MVENALLVRDGALCRGRGVPVSAALGRIVAVLTSF